jgi:putative transcriptional regulator
MVDSSIQAGKVLLAEPFMTDPNFRRAAVLLCDHTEEEGSVGFIMNKPLATRIDELVEDFPEFDAEVFFGGPVQTDTIHYIHNIGDLLEDSVEVSRGVYWGGDFAKLKFLISAELIKPAQIRFFVGYSGWSEGQLSDELRYGSWVVADMDANYLFKHKPAGVWRRVMANKGNAYSVIAQVPEHISWN